MKNTLEARLATAALTMARCRSRPRRQVLHHADRGVQDVSGDYQMLLGKHGSTCSMSRKGNCWDTAVAERCFAPWEWELIEASDWHTHAEAQPASFA